MRQYVYKEGLILNIEIIEIETFRRSMKREKITLELIEKLKSELLNNPEKGDLIPSSGGLRKVRMALSHTGKRGGARVSYFSVKGKIYLITAYKKSNKENLSAGDLKVFRLLTKSIKKYGVLG